VLLGVGTGSGSGTGGHSGYSTGGSKSALLTAEGNRLSQKPMATVHGTAALSSSPHPQRRRLEGLARGAVQYCAVCCPSCNLFCAVCCPAYCSFLYPHPVLPTTSSIPNLPFFIIPHHPPYPLFSPFSPPHQTTPKLPDEEEVIEDDRCFVCGDGGRLVLCDFPGCPRVYHQVLAVVLA
jgi:hypothetical protein